MKLLFIGTPDDQSYLPRLKPLVGTNTVALVLQEPTNVVEALLLAKAKGATNIVTTSPKLLHKLVDSMALSTVEKLNPSIDNYAGSIFRRTLSGIEYEILILDPLAQLVSVNHGSFITGRYLSKFLSPSKWRNHTRFSSFDLITPSNYQEILARWADKAAACDPLLSYVAVDIETVRQNLAITCIGYTFAQVVGESVQTESFVLPVDSIEAVYIMRQFNSTPYFKALQNGKYDCAYLARYNAPLYNYFFDTATMHHCWYSELPKDLGTLYAFYVRDSMYWKDLSNTPVKMEYYKYNALDCYSTALIVAEWLFQAPEWARTNYMQEFPLLFPAHMCEMTGIRVDVEELDAAVAEVEAEIVTHQTKLETMLGIKYHGRRFNVNSHVQTRQLRTALGCANITKGDEKSLNLVAFRHPLNNVIVDEILEIRGLRKVISTYLVEDKFYGPTDRPKYRRVLYALNPHGTDTGRLASREHHFWTGLQIQNIPRGTVVKRIFIADDGYVLAEVDLEQAESRDTAFISGDEHLIEAVSGSRDFHSVNTAAFFGVPYDRIYDDSKGKTIDKPLRDLAKRVNHGANYNMGPAVLVETMGLKKTYQAQSLLSLPKIWTVRQIAEHLLAQFHKTYPKIAGVYYAWVKATISASKKLVSQASHRCDYQATGAGWVRYCFGDPLKNKTALNAYVAHCPQSLNAMTLNKAFMQVFYDLMIHPVHSANIKVFAQIHDSILFQVRIGHEYLIDEVKKRMEIAVTLKGCDGKVREFTVPAAPKAGKDGKGAKRWSETE